MKKSHSVAEMSGTLLLAAGMLCLHRRNAKKSPCERRVRILSAVVTRNCDGSRVDPVSIVRRAVEEVVHGAALALVVWTAYEVGKRSQAHDGSTRLRLCKPSLN
jgi:hypothetical protein